MPKFREGTTVSLQVIALHKTAIFDYKPTIEMSSNEEVDQEHIKKVIQSESIKQGTKKS